MRCLKYLAIVGLLGLYSCTGLSQKEKNESYTRGYAVSFRQLKDIDLNGDGVVEGIVYTEGDKLLTLRIDNTGDFPQIFYIEESVRDEVKEDVSTLNNLESLLNNDN